MAQKVLFTLYILFTVYASIQAAFPSSYSWETVPGNCPLEGQYCVGCRKLRICFPSGLAVEATCESQNKLKPYCNQATNLCDSDSNSCSSEELPSEELNIECKEEGILPDLYNCRRYIMCVKSADKIKAFSFACGGNVTTTFNYNTKMCQYQYPCTDFSTTNLCSTTNRGKIVAYPPNRSIYGICPGQDNGKAIIGNCKENEEYDTTESGCKLFCSKLGRFADKDPTIFIECTLVGTKYAMNRYKCPLNLKFKNTLGYCA